MLDKDNFETDDLKSDPDEDEEAFLDACWEEAQTEEAMREVEMLEKEFAGQPPYKFSRGFDRRMAEAMGIPVRELRRKRKKGAVKGRRKGRTALKVAVVVLVFAVGFGARGIVDDPRVQAVVRQTIIHIFGDHGTLETPSNNEFVVVGNSYELGYVPKGFSLVNKDETDARFLYVFQNEDEPEQSLEITFVKGPIRLDFDAEYYSVTYQPVNEYEGYLCKYNDLSEDYILQWFNGKDNFLIMSSLNREEIIKIAESIQSK